MASASAVHVNPSVVRAQHAPHERQMAQQFGVNRLSPKLQDDFWKLQRLMGPPRKSVPIDVHPSSTYLDLPGLWVSENPNDYWSNIVINECYADDNWATDEQYGSPLVLWEGGDTHGWHRLEFDCTLLRETTYRGTVPLQQFRREQYHAGLKLYGIGFKMGRKELMSADAEEILFGHWETINSRNRATIEYDTLRAVREAGMDAYFAQFEHLLPASPNEFLRILNTIVPDIGGYHKALGGVEKINSANQGVLKSKSIQANLVVLPEGTRQGYGYGDPYKFSYYLGGPSTLKTPDSMKQMFPNYPGGKPRDKLMPQVRVVESHKFPITHSQSDDPLVHPVTFAEFYEVPSGEEILRQSLSFERTQEEETWRGKFSRFSHDARNIAIYDEKRN